jgi:hypothetical protein
MRGFRRVIGNALTLRILAFLIFSQPLAFLRADLTIALLWKFKKTA